jgi:enolase
LEKIEKLVRKIDKTPTWSLIGANALYALEAAILKAIAASYELELWQLFCEKPRFFPRPLGNAIGGGKHVKQETKTDIQEFLLMPKTKHFFDAYFINLQAYKIAKQLLLEKDKRYENKVTDENAFATTLSNEQVLELMNDVKQEIMQRFNVEMQLGMDLAASSFHRNGFYYYENPEKKLAKDEQAIWLAEMIDKYNLNYIEDPFHEDDFSSFSVLMKKISSHNMKCLLAGDDLTATQFNRVEKAIKEKCINALIIKPNQNGSLLETKRIVDFAKDNRIVPIISHRSAETMDNTIAHLAVGWQCPIIKTGILGKERFAKLHEILRIERETAGKEK